jgi:hypothetical protein
MGRAVIVQGLDGRREEACTTTRGKGKGKRVDFKELLRIEPDSGTTNKLGSHPDAPLVPSLPARAEPTRKKVKAAGGVT